MLYCVPCKKKNVTKAWREGEALWLKLESGLQKLVPVSNGILRVLYTEKESFSAEEKPGILSLPAAKTTGTVTKPPFEKTISGFNSFRSFWASKQPFSTRKGSEKFFREK